jgi:hypothetical protein
MARSSDYRASQNIEVLIKKETTVGTAVTADMVKYQVTSFSIPEASVPVEYSAQRAGQFTQTSTQGHHSEGTKMWTFDLTMRGTPTAMKIACDSVFEDNASEFVLNNDYEFPQASYKHASTSSPGTYTVFFQNGGSGDTNAHMVLSGCVGTGFTITEDIGSEGGEAVLTINLATAYMPVYTNTSPTGTTTCDEDTPKNIRNLSHTNTHIDVGGTDHEQTLHSFNVTVTRPIERIGFVNTTSGQYYPHGYAMTGPFEVTGSMTVVKNTDVDDLKARFYDGNTVGIEIGESSGMAISATKAYLNEPTVDNGGPMLMETIPFTVVSADAVDTTTEMLGITWA